MPLQVNRINVRLNPDVRKVIPRFFNTGDERSLELINRVMLLPDSQASELLLQVQQEFHKRYSNIRFVFEKHFELVKHLLPEKEGQDKLFIPYSVSDYATSFATVPLKELLDAICQATVKQ